MAIGRKTGGRAKGTPNKATKALSEVLDSLGLDVPKRLIELLPELEARDEAKVLTELMGYLYPKRKAIEHSFDPSTLPDGELKELVTVALSVIGGKPGDK